MLYFLSKLNSFTKFKKGIVFTLVVLIMKTKKENIQSMCQKILSTDMLIYYW